MGELKRLDRKSIDKNRTELARLLGIPSGGIIVSENGRIEIHNIPEDDARRYSNILRNKVKDIRLIPGKYDFRKVPLPGQVPGRLVTISGMLKDNLTEEFDDEVYEIPFRGIIYKCQAVFLKDLKPGDKIVNAPKNMFDVESIAIFDSIVDYDNKTKQTCYRCNAVVPNDMAETRWVYTPMVYKVIEELPDVSFQKQVDKNAYVITTYLGTREKLRNICNEYHLEAEQISSTTIKFCGKYSDIMKYAEDFHKIRDVRLTEAKKKKKKRLGGTLNPDAGNVEHNINMFNHMNSPTGGPSNNPVSGPFGGDVSAPSIGGCCEAFERSKKELIEGMRLTNGMREDEHYYFDDGNYSYHFFSKQDLYGITNQFAILVVDYGFEFHYDKMYRDEKSNMDVIPTSMRHERPKKICYFEFDEDTQPDIVDAFLDDDMNAFREAVKAAAEKEIEKNPLVEKRVRRKFRLYYWDPSIGKYDPSLESYEDVEASDEEDAYAKFMTDTDMKYEVTGFEEFILNNPMRKSLGESAETKYYMAKYRGANTDRLHKVYFSCDGNFEDAENLLDELIAEPYTDARVLGTVSPAAAERDGFTKIGGTSNKELDDDFNMSTRTLW